MKTKSAATPATPFAKIPKTYAGLMAMHLLRPIHDQIDAENAAEVIDLLAGHRLNAEQMDYLDLLSDLYERWESTQFPIANARGAELLRLVLAERGENGAALAELLGVDSSLAYRLLRGERQLTATQVRKLAECYGLDAAALLG
jgi:HTH-type transcriptional regulator/antitoxin HigA